MPPQALQLRDVHVPHVSWWPLAPGWWVLVALVLLAGVFAAWQWRRRIQHRRFVESVLSDLRQAGVRYREDGDNAAFAASAHQLLRRVARARDPHSVTLSAGAWLGALAAMAPKRDIARLAALHDVVYRPSAPLDAEAVAADVEAWVRDVLAPGAMRRAGRAHAPA